MATRRQVDASMLQGLLQSSETQEVKKGSNKSSDSKFPAFSTPVNQDILVYFPRTNVVTTENGENMLTLSAYVHDYKVGQSYGQLRCVSGLSGSEFTNMLGYDGSCPACEATQDCWDLYRKKLAAGARQYGVDPQNDPTDILKPVREKILQEMDLRGSEEYVTFPVVIIPLDANKRPTPTAASELRPVFVTWKRKRYEETILGGLENMLNKPDHPAGMFWFWKYSYNTGGKQANARDSAKSAKFAPIPEGTQVFGHLITPCETVAKDFTLVKAAEVIVANQFMYKEDIQKEVDKIMSKTRTLLELADVQEVSEIAKPALQNPLANFAIASPSAQPSQVQNLGVVQGNPVKFGKQ